MEGLVFSPALPTALAVPWLLLFPAASLALWWQSCLLWIKAQSGPQASALARILKGMVPPGGMVGAGRERAPWLQAVPPEVMCIFRVGLP